MTAQTFLDLGGGLYLAEVGIGEQYVADSRSAEPDHLYGPAAWRGRAGPQSGRTLIALRYVDRDAYLAAVDENIYADGPYPGECPLWPAIASVTEAGHKAGIVLNASSYAGLTEFLAALATHLALHGNATLATVEKQDRLKTAEHIHAGLSSTRTDLH